MKRQTFIAYLQTADGKQVTFERFNCKKVSTVKNQIVKLWLNSSLYRACCKGAQVVRIYATPDGYHTAPECLVSFELPYMSC